MVRRNSQVRGSGYFKEHATKPQTIGYALADSPSGQANWMYEKFIGWADNANLPDGHIAFDKVLDNITLYWVTDTSASSARFYWEATQAGMSGFSGGHHRAANGRNDFSSRNLPCSERLGTGKLAKSVLLVRGRQGRPLCCDGATDSVCSRDAACVSQDEDGSVGRVRLTFSAVT